MKTLTLSAKELRAIDKMVAHFVENTAKFESLLSSWDSMISSSKELQKLIHTTKGRVKDPTHLRDKLIRKFIEAKAAGLAPDYNPDNLFQRVNDLAGLRIIHLHTRQIEGIHKELLGIFEEYRWVVKEGPIAKTWDIENRAYFKSIGFDPEESDSLYTSVHYVLQPNSKSELTCEIQVRTLMEEVWGEVDHTINYPKKSELLACREQIKVLARMTSSCSRLVDSIFLSDSDGAKSPLLVASKRRSTVRTSANGKA
ncbi:(p)ppGpp synthetase [Variovorax sp. RO1]|uniref:RelA/SpoT domain-containing protein n=1 Tax=Variovorax sp. RO1 TaxID=2066034 RepID=UPI000C71701D|nr:RelA/SpoT domain-containing protein [Variovorax sp. RO1]PLC07331.1 (p)ppGpp synthetase [Variovorax sp. RO1]